MDQPVTTTPPALLRPFALTLRDGRKEVVFIDAALADLQTLIDGMPAGVEIRLIDAQQDGFAQMALWAENHSAYDAIHVLSHGTEARKQLGSATLTADNLNDYAPLLERIGESLAEDGDFLLYGCNVAQGEAGRAFVEDIARITRADVAASDDATGAAAKGGDWKLEYATCTIEAGTAIDVDARDDYGHLLNTTLAAGDIAVLGLNVDDPASLTDNQRWAFVALTDISSGTVIHFTDESYDSDAGEFYGATAPAEGHMTWAVGTNITAGTTFVVTNNSSSGAATIRDTGGNEYSGVSGSVGRFGTTGDQIFVYQGTAGTAAGATFVYGLNTGQSGNYTTGEWAATASTANQIVSDRPPGLVDGTSAAVLTSSSTSAQTIGGALYGFDNMKYAGITTGTREQILAAIGDAANWAGNDDTAYDFSAIGNFTLTVPSTAPTLTATGANPNFTEDAGATTALFSNSNADVVDSGQTFSGMTLTVSNLGTGDVLSIGGTTVALTNGNSVSVGSGTATVSVSGSTATVALTGLDLDNSSMNSLINGITFNNTAADPGTASRTVTIIQVADSGSSNNTTAVNIASTVSVINVNDAPTDLSLANATVNQSGGANASIGTLTATDPDSSTFTYTLVSGTGDTHNVLFNINGNSLRANDASTMAPGTYSVHVQTDDGAGGSYQESFSITVVDNVVPGFDESTPATANLAATTLDLTASLNEAGTLYYVVVADGAGAPNAAQVRAGQDAAGSAALKAGSAAVSSGAFTHTFNLTGLTAETAYDIYVVGEDDEGSPNLMVAPVKLDVSTPQAGPVVTDAHISITSSPSGTGSTYKVGDTVTAQWDNSLSGENQTGVTGVTMDFLAFGGGTAVVATETTPGSGIWSASYLLGSGSIDAGHRNVSVSATNGNGTTTTADTTNLTVDNQAPTVNDARIAISGASGTGSAYKISDTVTVTWNNTGTGDNNADIASVTADFSAFGGGSAVAATNSGDTWSATYTIVADNIDATNRNVSLSVTDDAGNVTTTADSTNATVDTQAPTVTDARISVSGATGTGGAYKIGDTVTATWNNSAGGDNDADTISGVTFDFSQFGGGAAIAATHSSGTWTATYTIVAGSIDNQSNRNVSVTATDNAGNTTTVAGADNVTVDNQPPSAPGTPDLAAASDSGSSDTDNLTNDTTPTLSGAGAAASSTVTIISSLAGTLGTTTADGSGHWSFTPGTALSAGSHSITATTTDAAGNISTPSPGLSLTIDTTAPTTTVTINSINTDSGTAGDFITNDNNGLTLEATLSTSLAIGERLEYSTDGTNWTDISSSVSGTSVSHTDNSLTSTTTVRMRVSDSAGNSDAVTNRLVTIDNTAPVLNASGSNPADNASNVAVHAALIVKFTEALDADSDLTKVYLQDAATHTPVAATVTINGSDELLIVPTSNLAHATAYYITWDAGALKDVAGNAAAAVNDESTLNFTTSAAPAPTPANPTVTLSLDNNNLLADQTATLTLTFSDPPVGFALEDITTNGGILSNLTVDSGNSRLYTATFTPTSDTQGLSGSIAIAAGTFKNARDQDNLASNTLTIAGDTLRPTVTSIVHQAPASEHTNADSLTYRVIFSEAVTGLDATDFTVTGTSAGISSVINAGTNAYEVTLSGGNLANLNAAVTLDFASDQNIADTAGNTLTQTTPTGTAQQTYRLDNTAPVLNASGSNPADNASNVAVHAALIVKFTEALDADSDLTKVYLQDAATHTPVAATVTINGSGELLIVPTSNLAHATAYYITWDAGALKDAAGNAAAAVNDESTLNFTTSAAPAPTPKPEPTPEPEPTPDPAIPPQDKWSQLPDDDGDGIPEIVEGFVPGLPLSNGGSTIAGDGNGDGIADAYQPEVTSVPFRNTGEANQQHDAPFTWVTLAATNAQGQTGPGPMVRNLRQLDAPAERPAMMEIPLGLIAFEAVIEQPGSSARLSLYVDMDMGINGYWKQDTNGTWVNLASAPHGGGMVEDGGRLRLDFILEDGGPFDADGRVDGVITGPGAVAFMPDSITNHAPTLPSDGFWL